MPTLIDTILRWCIACPFKGYCQQMLGINIVFICHKPQEKHGKQASMKGLWTGQRENSEMHWSPALFPGYSPTWLWISTVSLRCGPCKIGCSALGPGSQTSPSEPCSSWTLGRGAKRPPLDFCYNVLPRSGSYLNSLEARVQWIQGGTVGSLKLFVSSILFF